MNVCTSSEILLAILLFVKITCMRRHCAQVVVGFEILSNNLLVLLY